MRTAATAVRDYRLRKSRSAAYFFAEPGLGLAFAFGLGTLSAGFACLTVLGFGVDCFVVFFGMIISCLGASAEPIAGIVVDRRVAYKATAVTAMRFIASVKNGRSHATPNR